MVLAKLDTLNLIVRDNLDNSQSLFLEILARRKLQITNMSRNLIILCPLLEFKYDSGDSIRLIWEEITKL